MIEVVVDSRIRVAADSIPDGCAKDLRAAFTHENGKRMAMEAAGIRGFWAEPRLIPTWGESKEGVLSFPRGGIGKVRQVLRDHEISYRMLDRRLSFDPSGGIPDTLVDLWPHQQRIVDSCARRENCLVKSGTGSGKTSALLALYAELKVPTLVIVHSRGLLKQWVERAQKELGLSASEVGIVGDGKRRVRDLTIAIVHSALIAAKSREFRESFGAVFADEVHKFAAKTFYATVDQFPARYRIGASDDQRRKDRKEFLIHDLFGEVAEAVTDKELVAGGHVMDVETMVVPTEFAADWYGVPKDKDDTKRPEFGRLLEEMAGDRARQEVIEKIIESELAEDRQILVMAHRREQCHALGAFAARRTAAGYLIGGPDYATEFDRTVREMKSGKVRVGVGTYQATGTGIDLPGVEVGIACTPILANRGAFRQARGRVCRAPAGKTTARLYVLWDRKVYGLRHLANAASWSRTSFVWDGAAWVPAKQYLKAARQAAKEEADGEAKA